MLQQENFSKVHPPLQQECLLGKGRLRNGPESSAVTIHNNPNVQLTHPQNGWWNRIALARLAKWDRSVVCCSKFQIEKKSPSFCKVFSPPHGAAPFPHPPCIYTLVLD